MIEIPFEGCRNFELHINSYFASSHLIAEVDDSTHRVGDVIQTIFGTMNVLQIHEDDVRSLHLVPNMFRRLKANLVPTETREPIKLVCDALHPQSDLPKFARFVVPRARGDVVLNHICGTTHLWFLLPDGTFFVGPLGSRFAAPSDLKILDIVGRQVICDPIVCVPLMMTPHGVVTRWVLTRDRLVGELEP